MARDFIIPAPTEVIKQTKAYVPVYNDFVLTVEGFLGVVSAENTKYYLPFSKLINGPLSIKGTIEPYIVTTTK